MTLFPNKVTFGGSGKGKCSVTPVSAGASSRHPGLVTTTLDSADYRKCPSVHGVPVDIVTGLSPWEDVHGKCSERSRGRSLARWTTSPCPQNRSPVILLCHGPTHHPAPCILPPVPNIPSRSCAGSPFWSNWFTQPRFEESGLAGGGPALCGHSEVIYGGWRQLLGKMKGLTVKESRSSEKQGSPQSSASPDRINHQGPLNLQGECS